MKSILRQNSRSQKQQQNVNSNNVVLIVDNEYNSESNSDLNVQKQSLKKNVSQHSLNTNNESNINMSKQTNAISEQKAQRLKHFENLNQFEHQYNGGNLALMNSLQDNEFNEILTSVNDYINLSLNKVNKFDNIINVSWSDISANQNTSWNKKARKTTVQDMQQFDDKLSTLSSSSAGINQNESIITVTSINPIDLLQNGLRSGPFDTVKLTASEIEQNKQHHGGTSSKNKTDTKTIIKLKYLLELDLNVDYFDFNQVDDKGLVNSIRFKKKPKKWSIKDYDQISIDLSTSKDESFQKVINQLITHREKEAATKNQQTKIDYLKLSKPKSYRYLNSKALFDRLLKSFSSVLKYEWPYYHNPSNKENVSINEIEQPSALSTSNTVKSNQTNTYANNSNNNNNNTNVIKYPISEDCKKCISNDNQLRISFKWRGTKHKDLEIVILINIGIKYVNNCDLIFLNRINESMLEILNNFLVNGGYFKTINKKLDIAQFDLIANWSNKNLKINLCSIYLCPSGVHHWTISLDCLKLNLIRFLVWANSLNQSFIGVDTVTDLLFNSSSTTTYNTNPNKFESKQPLYNYFSTIYLGKSSLQLLLKSIQIFTSLFTSLIDEKSKLEDDNLNFVDLCLENILLEIKLNLNSKVTWSNDYLFDHIWSILIRLRSFMLNSKVYDSFELYENVLPKIFYKYVGFHDLNFHNNTFKPINLFEKQQQHPLTTPFEQAMKTVFTSVIYEEIYFPGQAKLFELTAEKEKTIFNKNSNLINDILDYKKKTHNTKMLNEQQAYSIGHSTESGGKATLGSKTTKKSIESND